MSGPATTGSVTESAKRGTETARASRTRPLVSARYVTCVVVLLAAAAGIEALKRFGGISLTKEPVELKKSLREFDERRLAPEYSLHPVRPKPLEHDVLETLGTQEYVDLRIIKAGAASNDPTSMAIVFISYYTGKPDMVPHVPDECLVAGGLDRVGRAYSQEVNVSLPGAESASIPVRVLQFRGRDHGTSNGSDTDAPRPMTVLYFFHCNNQYKATRSGVRMTLGDIWERFGYYAKFEVRFVNEHTGAAAPLEDSLEALGPLLEKLMPIVFEDHFADWEALHAEVSESSSGAAGEG